MDSEPNAGGSVRATGSGLEVAGFIQEELEYEHQRQKVLNDRVQRAQQVNVGAVGFLVVSAGLISRQHFTALGGIATLLALGLLLTSLVATLAADHSRDLGVPDVDSFLRPLVRDDHKWNRSPDDSRRTIAEARWQSLKSLRGANDKRVSWIDWSNRFTIAGIAIGLAGLIVLSFQR